MGQVDATGLARQPVGGQPVQKRLGAGAGHVELGKARQVHDAHPLPHRAAFPGDQIKDVVAPVLQLFDETGGGEILRSLPAVNLGIDRAFFFQLLIERRHAARAAGVDFTAGQRGFEHVVIVVETFRAGVVRIGVAAEATRIDAGHVDFGIAVNHPLRQVLAAARALGDADGRAAALPEVANPMGGSDQRVAIGRVRDRAVDDALDARLGEDWHPLQRLFQPGGDAVNVAFEQLVFAVPFRPTAAGRPGLLRAVVFVDADKSCFLLLPIVAGGGRVAHHWKFAVDPLERRQRFGHQILVLHVGDRRLDPDPGGHFTGITAAGVDQVFASHCALFGDHLEFTGRKPLDVGHLVAADDGRAQLSRAGRHGVAGACRVHMAVHRGMRAGEDAVGIQPGVQLLDPVGANDLDVKADIGGKPGDVTEPVNLFRAGRQPNAAATVPARRMAG